MKRVILNQEVGSAKKGDVYIQGLHGVPNHETYKSDSPDDFYWKEGTTKEDNGFLRYNWLVGEGFNYIN